MSKFSTRLILFLYWCVSTKSEIAGEKAIKWLWTQRMSNGGWHNDTAQVLAALHQYCTTTTSDICQTVCSPLDLQLSRKQLEFETVLIMLQQKQQRHHTADIDVDSTNSALAEHVMALAAVFCIDVRHFYGYDLVSHVHNAIHPANYNADDADDMYAFTVQMQCACALARHYSHRYSAHHKRHVRHLLDIANGVNSAQNRARALLALRTCSTHQMDFPLRRAMAQLAAMQRSDGSIEGHLYATALTVQALDGAGVVDDLWNRSAAHNFILAKQDPDGAFTDPRLTAEILLALSAPPFFTSATTSDSRHPQHMCLDRNLTSVDMETHQSQTKINGHLMLDVSTNTTTTNNNNNNNNNRMFDMRNVTVTYTLWMGTNITENHTLVLSAPVNTTFYQIMCSAQDLDGHFQFEASAWPNGHYVHTLGGHKEEPFGYYYWLLYRLPDMPDPSTPPANQLVAPVGVDELRIEDGDHYLFWYKKL